MHTRTRVLYTIALMGILLFAACSAPAQSEVAKTVIVERVLTQQVAKPTEAPAPRRASPELSSTAYPGPSSSMEFQAGESLLPSAGSFNDRMIIKNAEIRLLVEDTDITIDRSTQVVEDVGGYILSERLWYQGDSGENAKFATLTIGVPVDRFEEALRRLRSLAIQVLDENIAGQDVTTEYVDLQSQLDNLKATRDRIRQFLDQATKVEDALKVNEQLTSVEGQINQVEGRMKYLSGRSAYSTITLQIEPNLPTPTPTPTITPTPTTTPSPWYPGQTVTSASNALISVLRALLDILIWLVIVGLPIFGIPILIIWIIWRLIHRKSKGEASITKDKPVADE